MVLVMNVFVPEVTVIVPVYNGEVFIDDCLGFIRAQTFHDYEVIIVVDKRNSDVFLQKVKELSKTVSNCRVLVQEDDMRLGGARNLGVENALGRLIWFMDVDDLVSPYFLEEMVSIQKDISADFVCCNFVYAGSEYREIKEFPKEKCTLTVMDRDHALYARAHEKYPVTSWCKLFVKDFLIKNDLRFNDTMSEDIYHTYSAILSADKVVYYSRPMYGYRRHCNSITCSERFRDDRGHDEIRAYDFLESILSDYPGLGSDLLRRFALMRMRASSHMTYPTYLKYAKSKECKSVYDIYLRSPFSVEGAWHRYLPRFYYVTIRVFCKLVYYRNGRPFVKIKDFPEKRKVKG